MAKPPISESALPQLRSLLLESCLKHLSEPEFLAASLKLSMKDRLKGEKITIDLQDPIHLSHLISFSCMTCSYLLLKEDWLASLFSDNSLWEDTLRQQVVCIQDCSDSLNLDCDALVETLADNIRELRDRKGDAIEKPIDFMFAIAGIVNFSIMEAEDERDGLDGNDFESVMNSLKTDRFSKHEKTLWNVFGGLEEFTQELIERTADNCKKLSNS